MSNRKLEKVIPSMAVSDGAGVKLRRSLGSVHAQRHVPFLMFDEFYSDDPGDYLAGFPAHPHRDFETVTYMLDGHMRHEDSSGNQRDLGPGDVQWMTAAQGIVHSERSPPRLTAVTGISAGTRVLLSISRNAAAQRAPGFGRTTSILFEPGNEKLKAC